MEAPAETMAARDAQIVRVSIIGIITNVALAAFKAAVGLLSNSIAVTLDAVNNLSDAASSAITIAGTKLAAKPADHEHPFGYGRVEYLTTTIVAAIILAVGLSSLNTAIQSIAHPEDPAYDTSGIIILAVAVVVKLALGSYVMAQGRRLGSNALVASGTDARSDALISSATIVAALIYTYLHISLEAYLGAIISLVIIKAGLELLEEALEAILGRRVEAEVANSVKETVASVEGVRGAYDLILTDYGPHRLWGSIHMEVDHTLSAWEIDQISREVQSKVFAQDHVVLHTVGIYACNLDEDSTSRKIRIALDEICEREPHALQVHGLYVNEELKGVSFDLVVDFAERDPNGLRERIVDELHTRFPDFAFVATIDTDIS